MDFETKKNLLKIAKETRRSNNVDVDVNKKADNLGDTSVEEDIASFKNQINQLKNTITDLNDEISALTAENISLKNENTRLCDELYEAKWR